MGDIAHDVLFLLFIISNQKLIQTDWLGETTQY